jgi:hypothetical protein
MTKCHVGYQKLQALGHQISNLGIGTADSTIELLKASLDQTTLRSFDAF